MFSHIFSFEVNYWLRRPMVYIFILINFLLVFGATSSDNIQIGSAVGNVLRNSPSQIQFWFSMMSVLSGLVMTAAFMQGAALRDFDNNSYQIVFSSPISRASYYFGRFFGAAFVSLLPAIGIVFGVLLGSIIGPLAGWSEAERFGAIYWSAYSNSYFIFVIPIVLISGSLIFTTAALSRSTMAAFIAALSILILWIMSGTLLSDIDSENLTVFSDILGVRVWRLCTKYWTIDDKNTLSVSLWQAKMGINRLIWLAVGAAVLLAGYFKFSFAEKSSVSTKKKEKNKAETPEKSFTVPANPQSLPVFTQQTGVSTVLRQLASIAKTEYQAVTKDTTFIVLMGLGVVLIIINMIFAKGSYGLTQYPVTYKTIEGIKNTISPFLIAVVMFYSGQLIWRERDAKFHQIYNALPYPTWISYAGKFLAMLGIVYSVQLFCIVCGIIKQVIGGYYTFELGLYVKQLFLYDAPFLYITMIVFAMLIHTLVNNKYIGFFVFLITYIGIDLLWSPLNISSNLVRLFSTPKSQYSDIAGFGPSFVAQNWFTGYWLLFSALLAALTIAFWVRSGDENWKNRFLFAKNTLFGNLKTFTLGSFILFALTGGWIYYNTNVLNEYTTEKEAKKQQVAYEKTYKKFDNVATPTLVDITYQVDIFPKERNLNVRTTQKWVNKTNQAIDSLHFTINDGNEVRFALNIPNSRVILNDTTLGYRIYKLEKPLQQNDTLIYSYTATKKTEGFENDNASTDIVENGTFFNNAYITPNVGYSADGEMTDKNDRKKYGLPEKSDLMPRLPEKNEPCGKKCAYTYLDKHSNWVTMQTTISTSSDQIAIAPGSLVKEWKTEGRNYYTYKLDRASMFFGSFMSARYQVKRETWRGIQLEVYYDAKHPYNIDRIVNSMKKSLTYYTENFGPYFHKQCRVIEAPNYYGFAQSFPGTMPYGEDVGFIDKYDDKTDIDKIFYVVAHEIGHQYWAHQLTGANVQGATLLSETFAQYSALMTMQKEYGRDAMRKFLSYESDRFLAERSYEKLKENPLMKVEASQGYIHYQKGSLVMFYLKEMIGEATVNEALREILTNYAYKEPPYATSHVAVDAFAARTPDSLKYLITDMFETITIFDNRTLETTCKKLPNGSFETTIKVQSEKFRADSLGKESPIAINDWIEVGVFDEPLKGKKYGVPLELRRVKIKAKDNTFSFITKKQPYEGGIDPNCFLIDKTISDNVKKVSL